jgi:hypothetical protein
VPKREPEEPKGRQKRPKWSQKGQHGGKKAPKGNQKAIKMHQKIDTRKRSPKWCQKLMKTGSVLGPKLVPKSMKNHWFLCVFHDFRRLQKVLKKERILKKILGAILIFLGSDNPSFSRDCKAGNCDVH